MQVCKILCIFVFSSYNRGNWRVLGGQGVCKGTRTSATISHYHAVRSRETEEIWAQREWASFPLCPPLCTSSDDTSWKTNENMVGSWSLIPALDMTRMNIYEIFFRKTRNGKILLGKIPALTQDWLSLQERNSHWFRDWFNQVVMVLPLKTIKRVVSHTKQI